MTGGVCVCVCVRLEQATKAAADIREKIDQQNTQLCDFEAEINMLRRRIEALTADKDKDKKQIAQLQDALNRARIVSSCRVSFYNTIQYNIRLLSRWQNAPKYMRWR